MSAEKLTCDEDRASPILTQSESCQVLYFLGWETISHDENFPPSMLRSALRMTLSHLVSGSSYVMIPWFIVF